MDTDTIIVLTTSNFSEWSEQIKGLATEMEVWDFLDPQQANQAPTRSRPPNYNTYDVTVSTTVIGVGGAAATQASVTQKVIAISELSAT